MSVIFIMLGTLIVSIVRRERPETVVAVNLIAWLGATVVMAAATGGFQGWGFLTLLFLVIPSLIVILIVCAVYSFWHSKSMDKSAPEEQPKKQQREGRIGVWAAVIAVALIATNWPMVLRLGDTVERIVYTEEQLKERDTREWQKNRAAHLERYASSFSGGSGTEEDPFLVSNAAELAAVRDVTSGYYGYDIHYIQIADIDLSQAHPNADGGFWEPIGNQEYRFAGNYDGGGYAIYGLRLCAPQMQESEEQSPYPFDYAAIGLFGRAENASLKNIRIEAPEFEDNYDYAACVGFLAGNASGCRIENCSVRAQRLTNTGVTGGLLGMADDSEISRCEAIVEEMDVEEIAGGLLGLTEYGGGGIFDCKSSTTIRSFGMGDNAYGEVGGLAGVFHGWDIARCSAQIRIIREEKGGVCTIGGLVGNLSLRSGEALRDCFAVGSIETANQAETAKGEPMAGGLAGNLYHTSILRSYAVVSISGIAASPDEGQMLGSLVGLYDYEDDRYTGRHTIRQCYYSAASGSYGPVGVCGEQDDDGVLTPYSNPVEDSKQIEAIALNEVEMRHSESFSGFDFETVWAMDTENPAGYPLLKF
ncbi:MAG: hypothetical protein LBS19_01430 [Clostridiales bacterium]|jgi:hypothetical protein|nr:hypothetical protein [Clostridiales bacterium]